MSSMRLVRSPARGRTPAERADPVLPDGRRAGRAEEMAVATGVRALTPVMRLTEECEMAWLLYGPTDWSLVL